MLVFYTYEDIGQITPTAPADADMADGDDAPEEVQDVDETAVGWLDQKIIHAVYQRSSIMPFTANAYNARFYYDGWVGIAIEMICDWPMNLFRGPSTGDGAGTKIDHPTGGSTQLGKRLSDATHRLNEVLGVSTKPTVSVANFVTEWEGPPLKVGPHGYPPRAYNTK
ncbi:hypothetical protein GCM10018962_36480 [Dactylosporangium matsuzakiense]|uniref:Uncharacterized protein n=2 Tax=Dactylosporangium matsuzakiense TaxID=53360 RepID=A0A9W6KVQ2_9ACTN|nr:hypothetical protein GCM10017581_103250 [Dactylosporangium matsuzakiense]